MTDDVDLRSASASDVPAVRNVLDGAALAVDSTALRDALERDAVLVAVADRQAADPVGGATTDGSVTILGALVLDGREIIAVAVRRRRRDQGIGTALVETAAERRERLVASFDQAVRPFWESLGFAIEPTEEEDRYRGVRETS